jgi:hypothetical protein
MNQKTLVGFGLALCGMLTLVDSSSAQGTAITYQGRLNGTGGPLTGNYDFEFSAWSADTGGTQLGSILQTNDVAVTNGLFAVTLDFGAIYSGAPCWLDIEVRTNGSTAFYDLGSRQDLTPVPYAVYAATAASAASATNFSGALAGDVTGTQSATVVSTVGGQSAANVAAGAVLANAATSADTVNTIVKRDGSGGFTASTITASGFSGSGASLTTLNAASVTTGTLPTTVLPASVAQLGNVQTFTGINTFANAFVFAPGNGTLTVDNDSGIVPGIVAQGGNAPGHARFRNALEVWPNTAATVSGYVDVRNTSSNATIVLNGQNGSVSATSFTGDGSALTGISSSTLGGNDLSTIAGENGLSVGTNIFLNDNPIYLRDDENHGLAYNGPGVTNFPSGDVLPDGPVLWGYTGGALGVLNGGAQAALTWNNSSVGVANTLNVGGNASVGGTLTVSNITATGILSAANLPGVNYFQVGTEDITVAASTSYGLGSMGNFKPGTGTFVITAYANIQANYSAYSGAELQLYDVTSGQTLLTQAYFNPDEFGATAVVTLTWVVPITTAGGYENYGIAVTALSGGSIQILGHNLTVMYFPGAND